MTAPAAMPSVDQIIPLIQEVMGRDNYALALHTARKVDALFAPILAEKERDNRQLRLEVAEEKETSRISIYGWRDKANEMEARALAAEAALAAERERADMAVRQMIKQNDRLAAIRAQGE